MMVYRESLNMRYVLRMKLDCQPSDIDGFDSEPVNVNLFPGLFSVDNELFNYILTDK